MGVPELQYKLYYSYNLTKLHSILMRRISNMLTVFQIFLGTAIAVDIGGIFSFDSKHWNLLIGLIVTLISAILFVYKPSETAVLSSNQFKKYKSILSKLDAEPSFDIASEMAQIESDDLEIEGALEDIAQKRTNIQLKLDDDIRLNCKARIIACFIGEYFQKEKLYER